MSDCIIDGFCVIGNAVTCKMLDLADLCFRGFWFTFGTEFHDITEHLIAGVSAEGNRTATRDAPNPVA